MQVGKLTTVAGLLAVGSFLTLQQPASAAEPTQIIDSVWVYETDSTFHDLRNGVLDAITEQGMRVAFEADSKHMLDRTGRDLGYKDGSVYDTGAEIIEFCKADLSHELSQANPHYISFCPFAIAVYDLKDKPGKAYISFRMPPDNIPQMKPVIDMVKEIVDQGLEGGW